MTTSQTLPKPPQTDAEPPTTISKPRQTVAPPPRTHAKRDSDRARTAARKRGDPRELDDVQHAATVALTVLRRALIEGAPVTREAITHEAAIVFATNPLEAASRLDCQAEGLGVSSLL